MRTEASASDKLHALSPARAGFSQQGEGGFFVCLFLGFFADLKVYEGLEDLGFLGLFFQISYPRSQSHFCPIKILSLT